MNVYLIPLPAGRLEPYFEHEEDVEFAAGMGAAPGVLARLRLRFAAMIREAERLRHERQHDGATSFMGRLQRTLMGWVAERVAEQRLLWHLRGVSEATLHVPDSLDRDEALRAFREALQKDGDRHLRLLGIHLLGLLASAPFMFFPGPNLLGYFFTFTVIGHFLAFRGARRGQSAVRWTIASSAELTALGRAAASDAPDRYRLLHEAGEALRLPKVARFVERMVARPA